MIPRSLGSFHEFEISPSVKLRYFRSSLRTTPRGTIIILTGRASYLEKYQEIIEFWNLNHYQVFALDWRGQGGSTRACPGSDVVHIDTYSDYVQDLTHWLNTIVLPAAPRPLVFYSVSMGALVAGLYLQQDVQRTIDRCILVVPMFGLLTHPFPVNLVKFITRMICFFGLGHNQVPCVKHALKDPSVNPQLCTQGLTFRWLHATFEALKLFSLPENLRLIQIPVMVTRAGDDGEIDNSVDLRICENIADCTVKTYENASHGIHHTNDATRTLLLRDCIFFLHN